MQRSLVPIDRKPLVRGGPTINHAPVVHSTQSETRKPRLSGFTKLTIIVCPGLFYLTFGFDGPATLAATYASSFSASVTDFFAQEINREVLTGSILVLWVALWIYHTFGDDSPRYYQTPAAPPAERRPVPFNAIYGGAGPATYSEAHEALSAKPTAFGPMFRD